MVKGADDFFERSTYGGMEFMQGPRIPSQQASKQLLSKLDQVVVPPRRPAINGANGVPQPLQGGRCAAQFI